MINLYAQYSFSGYKIFRLTEDAAEEVTASNRLDIPDSAIQLFSHYGIKLLASKDLLSNYILFVNDIPCKEHDDMRRAKTCSMIMTATSVSESNMLKRIAVMLVFELDKFEEFFSSLFTVKDTLEFDYLRFNEFIKNAADSEVISQDRLRNAMNLKATPIVVYTTEKHETAITPLFRNFEAKQISRSFLLKWIESERKIQDSAVERIGFRSLLYMIISKLTAIWKN